MKYVVKVPDVLPIEPMLKKAFKATKAKMIAVTAYGDNYISKQ